MMHPVGPLPRAIYWRRRLALLLVAAVAILLVMQVASALASGGDTSGAGPGPSASQTSPRPSAPRDPNQDLPAQQRVTVEKLTPPPAGGSMSSSPPSSAPSGSPTTSNSPSNPPSNSPSNSPSSTPPSAGASPSVAPPEPCNRADLRVSAAVEQSSYPVGQQPVLLLEATNTTRTACTESFGDANVELRINNGESRVWGSNDCAAGSSTSVRRTMEPGVPVRVRMVWSGLTSQPKCAGTRQQANAGAYTLYAQLDGKNGSAAPFALT